MNFELFNKEQEMLGGNLSSKQKKALKKECKQFDEHIQAFRVYVGDIEGP